MASLVQAQIEEHLRAAGLGIRVTTKHSTERKESRITSTLEPRGAAGLIALPADIPHRLVMLGDDFDPSRRDNSDDWLDALQRVVAADLEEVQISPADIMRGIYGVRR